MIGKQGMCWKLLWYRVKTYNLALKRLTKIYTWIHFCFHTCSTDVEDRLNTEQCGWVTQCRSINLDMTTRLEGWTMRSNSKLISTLLRRLRTSNCQVNKRCLEGTPANHRPTYTCLMAIPRVGVFWHSTHPVWVHTPISPVATGRGNPSTFYMLWKQIHTIPTPIKHVRPYFPRRVT